MKKVLLVVVFISFFLAISVTPIKAGLDCGGPQPSSATITNGNLVITATINDYNPSNTGYELISLSGENTSVATTQDFSPISNTNKAQVTFTIPNQTVKNLGLDQLKNNVDFKIKELGTATQINIPPFLLGRDPTPLTITDAEVCNFHIDITQDMADEINNYQAVIYCQNPNDCPSGSSCHPQRKVCVATDGTIINTDDSLVIGPEMCGTGIKTAIGCLPTETGPFINLLLIRSVSIGAGFAFLLILSGSFTLITSAGNPDSLKKGKEIITSAIIGLLFIIFSIFILKLIGVDILNIPTFIQ